MSFSVLIGKEEWYNDISYNQRQEENFPSHFVYKQRLSPRFYQTMRPKSICNVFIALITSEYIWSQSWLPRQKTNIQDATNYTIQLCGMMGRLQHLSGGKGQKKANPRGENR